MTQSATLLNYMDAWVHHVGKNQSRNTSKHTTLHSELNNDCLAYSFLVYYKRAYFLFLKIKLNRRHPAANTIPIVARISITTTSPVLNVWMISIGEPSGGVPSKYPNKTTLSMTTKTNRNSYNYIHRSDKMVQ